MRLEMAARAFDKMACVDAYSGRHAFFGQLSLYDDSKRDAEATERRVISTAVDVTIPTRRVVLAAGTRWIIGHGNPDNYRGSVIRMGWVAHEAPDLAQVRTLGQACRGEAGFKAYCGGAWIKNLVDGTASSDLAPQFHMHFGSIEPVRTRHLVKVNDDYFVVRSSHIGPAGTRIALSDTLEAPVVTEAMISGVTMDPVTEVRTTVNVTATVVFARWQSLFEYTHELAPKFGPGEIQVAIAKVAATPAVGWTVTSSEGVHRLDSVVDEGDIWLCKASLR